MASHMLCVSFFFLDARFSNLFCLRKGSSAPTLPSANKTAWISPDRATSTAIETRACRHHGRLDFCPEETKSPKQSLVPGGEVAASRAWELLD